MPRKPKNGLLESESYDQNSLEFMVHFTEEHLQSAASKGERLPFSSIAQSALQASSN